jgi:hypothetical protein
LIDGVEDALHVGIAFVERRDEAFDVARHLVDRVSEIADLVVARNVRSHGELTFTELARGGREPAHRAHDADGDEERAERRDEHGDRRADGEALADLRDVSVDGGYRNRCARHAEKLAVAPHRLGDPEPSRGALAADRLASAAGDGLLDLRRAGVLDERCSCLDHGIGDDGAVGSDEGEVGVHRRA